MAYTKITPIKSGTHIENSLDYIENSSKTENSSLIFSFMCSSKTAFSDFEIVQKNAIKKGNNIAHHIYQSFSPEDNISPEQALEIGKELMKKMYPNHQYVIAVHTDKAHLHSHIIVNSVDFENYKKINSNKESLGKMRKISDEICEENGLSVIKPIKKNHRQRLQENIDNAIEKSQSFDEFLELMTAEGYEIKQGKYLSFKGENDEKFMRLSSLGTAYNEAALRKRIEGKTDIKNTQTQVYSNKNIRMANRKKLKLAIDNSVKKSQSFDEFLDYMRKEDYEIKQGKYLSFKNKNEQRFIRLSSMVKSYGDDYSEEMIRLRLEDFDEYKRIKDNKIGKVINSNDKYYNRKSAAENINTKIKTINFMKENGIKNIDELDKKLSEIEDKNSSENREISRLKREVSARFDIINSLRIYWQYKPVAQHLRSIKNEEQREEYSLENKEKLEKFKNAIDVINASKNADGKLPKSEDLYKEIEQLNAVKDELLAKNKKTRETLTKYQNSRYNLANMLNSDTSNHQERQKQKQQNYTL